MDTHALKNKNASLLFYKGFPPFIHCFVLLDFYGCQITVLWCFKKCLRLYVEIPFCSFVWWYICSFLRQSMFFDVRSDENMSLLTLFMVWIHLNNLRMDIFSKLFWTDTVVLMQEPMEISLSYSKQCAKLINLTNYPHSIYSLYVKYMLTNWPVYSLLRSYCCIFKLHIFFCCLFLYSSLNLAAHQELQINF